jgi:5-methylcytosine-specific restriction protein A
LRSSSPATNQQPTSVGFFIYMARLQSLKPRVAVQGNRLNTMQPDTWRADKTSAQRGYGYKWQKARARYLQEHPLCVMCETDGRVELATVVDHIEPHQGDQTKFWNPKNWQGLCKRCHDSRKAKQEHAAGHR